MGLTIHEMPSSGNEQISWKHRDQTFLLIFMYLIFRFQLTKQGNKPANVGLAQSSRRLQETMIRKRDAPNERLRWIWGR